MKKIEFTREVLTDDPVWSMVLYKSNDINGSFATERACLEAVAIDNFLVDPEIAKILIETELDRLLIDNEIYVVFVDD